MALNALYSMECALKKAAVADSEIRDACVVGEMSRFRYWLHAPRILVPGIVHQSAYRGHRQRLDHLSSANNSSAKLVATKGSFSRGGHLDGRKTPGFQFFDRSGHSAFKVFMGFGSCI